jgi:putative PIN family toxin of toxin-antitoxin system
MIRVVIDTSVIVSALAGRGNSSARDLLKLAYQKQIELCYSKQTLQEITQKKGLESFQKPLAKFKAWYKYNATEITVTSKVELSRDPKDNKFLELAVDAKAKYLITFDKDLLSLSQIGNIRICKPGEFLDQI